MSDFDPVPAFGSERRDRSHFVQADVESEILRLCAVLEAHIDEHGILAERAARADAAYKNVHARALLTVEGRNAEEREARAHQQVEGEYLERRIAAGLEHHVEEATRGIRAQLSALQSIAANQRALVS